MVTRKKAAAVKVPSTKVFPQETFEATTLPAYAVLARTQGRDQQISVEGFGVTVYQDGTYTYSDHQ